MKIKFDQVFEFCAQQIAEALKKAIPQINVNSSNFLADLVPPPNLKWGDVAWGGFKLAKEYQLKPQELVALIKDHINPQYFSEISALGPYLNLRLTPQYHELLWIKSLWDQSIWQQPSILDAPRTMIEFSQPNTHKELHVGHLRNACLGDALVKISRFCGIPVISATFPGDIGMHVAKCLWYLHYHNQEPIPKENKGEWLGRLYSKAHIKLEDESQSLQAPIYKEQLTEILRQLENKQGIFYELWLETRQWSIELMKKIYSWLGIEFDLWYWESEVDEASRQYVKELFAQGKLIQSQGAIGMDLSEDKLGFCMLLKSDGTGLYATKDLELARRKFEDHKIEKSIYVVDVRQSLHFAQIFKVLEKLGFAQAKDCVHLQYNFVELPDGAMSSRKGNIVPISQLINKMEELIRNQYLSKYEKDWSEEDINKTAHQIAVGAIKYGMLKIDTQKKIIFNMNEWLKIDGDSGPFIQYSLARIKSLLRKSHHDFKSLKNINWNTLQQTEELYLLSQGMYFRSVVRNAALQERPHLLTHYLYELAKSFNLFYHQCPILNAQSSDLVQARLGLSFVIGQILEKGLNLLGIETPEKM